MGPPPADAPPLTFDLPSPAATGALAGALAGLLAVRDVVALWGDLGAGKTTFARGVVRALCGEGEEVPSPTFSLVQVYEGGGLRLYHFDLYRLEDPEEAVELGLDEALDEGVSLIEWPGRLGPLLPAPRLDVALTPSDDGDARRARLTATDGWGARLAPLGEWRAAR